MATEKEAGQPAAADRPSDEPVLKDEGERENAIITVPEHEKYNGVAKVEALSTAWGKKGLTVAYIGLLLGSIMTSLEVMTTFAYNPAATSAFSLHHVLSTVGVVSNVMMATVKPPIAKICDAFGRTEAMVISLVLTILGYVMKAASNNVDTFAASQIFSAAGSTGIIVFTQIFIADTTSLLNRALFSSLPDFPYVFTTWAGPELANAVNPQTNWRWGFGMWAIIIPVSFVPLLASLFVYQRKAKKMGLTGPSPYANQNWLTVAKNTWIELDIPGLILLSGSLIMILVPLTLTGANSTNQWQWKEAKTLVLIIIGAVTFVAWIAFEANPKLCPKPMFSWTMMKNKTVACSCGLGFFYFLVFYLPSPYFYTFQQVVRNSSFTEAGNISNIFTFSSSTMSIIISLIIKWSGRYKIWMLIGIPIYVLGYGLMIAFRTEHSTNVQIIFAQILTGLGGGTINVPAQVGLQAAAGHNNVAAATALFLTAISVGGAVGSAITGSIWSNLLPGRLEKHLAGTLAAQNVTDIYGDYFKALAFAVGTPERSAINAAYSEVYRIQLIVACCVAVPMIPLGLLMTDINLAEHDLDTTKGTVIGGTNATPETAVASDAPPTYANATTEKS